MTVRRLIAIVLILGCVSVAWTILGTSVIARTRSGYDMLGEQVEELWGAPHVQRAPTVVLSSPGQPDQYIGLESSRITVDIGLDYRRKGLLWYSTYSVVLMGAIPL